MSYDVLEKKIELLPAHYQQEVIPQMSGFEKTRHFPTLSCTNRM